MILYWLIIVSLIAVGEAIGLVFMRLEVSHWMQKFYDAIEELCPIEWDYTKKDGWRDERDPG